MRNFRRETISFRIARAISRSFSADRPSLKNRRHSAMVISVTWEMLRSPKRTQSISFFSLAPLHAGQGMRFM